MTAWGDATKARTSFEMPLFESTIWDVRDRVLLQIGLNANGGSICAKANKMGLKGWGAQQKPTFHASCHKIFETTHLKPILSGVDILSLAPSNIEELHEWLNPQWLSLLPKDGICNYCRRRTVAVTPDDFAPLYEAHPFRGVLIDAHSQVHLASSRIWKIPNLILTPGVSESPSNPQDSAVRLFRKNLRQFLHGSVHNIDTLLVECFNRRMRSTEACEDSFQNLSNLLKLLFFKASLSHKINNKAC